MNRFYIYYWGLICHIGKHKNDTTEKTHATIVHAPGSHIPFVIASPTDAVRLEDDIRFRGGNGNATFSGPFTDWVPSLKAILDVSGNADAKSLVYGKQPPHLHADYPRTERGGSVHLRPVNLYENASEHRLLNGTLQRRGPVARLVVAVVETNDSQLELLFNRTDSRILTPDNPCILIANVEPPDGAHDPCDPADNHFSIYSDLLDNAEVGYACDSDAHNDSAEFVGCEWVLDVVFPRRNPSKKYPFAALSTECGNTQWP